MVARFGLDIERRGPGGRVFHAVCGASGGTVFPGDRPFMVSRIFLEHARRQARGFWNDNYGRGSCVARTGGFFP